MNSNYEALEEKLVYFYKQYAPLFKNIPPGYDADLPQAKLEKDQKTGNTIFKFEDTLLDETGESALMSFTPGKHPNGSNSISVSKEYCRSPQDLNKKLFPLLHEMIHVKQYVLGSDDFKHKSYPDMDLGKAQQLFDELIPIKDEYYNKQLKKHGPDFVMLCYFLSNNILSGDKKYFEWIGKSREVKVPNKIKWLIKSICGFKIHIRTVINDLVKEIKENSVEKG